MATMTRDSWTDERLDDLTERVDDGFKDVRAEMRGEFSSVRSEMRNEFASVRSEMRTEFASVRADMRTESASVRAEVGFLRSDVSQGFADIHGELATMNRTLILTLAGLASTLIGAIAAVIVAHPF